MYSVCASYCLQSYVRILEMHWQPLIKYTQNLQHVNITGIFTIMLNLMFYDVTAVHIYTRR